MPLETPRLLLRRFTDEDAVALVNLDNDARIMRYINPDCPPVTRESILRGMLPRVREYDALGDTFGFFAAVEKTSGRFIGWFHFRPPRDPLHGGAGDIEFGYRLRPDAWGRGYATEGARALLNRGFAEAGVQRVTAVAMAENTASIGVMRKLGMTFDGELTENYWPRDDNLAARYVIDRSTCVTASGAADAGERPDATPP